MHTFYALSGKEKFKGAMYTCFDWATQQIKNNDKNVVHIFYVRPHEKEMKVVAEVTRGGVRPIPHGRRTHIRKADKHG